MRYYLSLGSNLGERRDNLLHALDALEKSGVKVVRASSIYSAQPIGNTAQPWFYNQVIEVDTALSPCGLLALAKKVERNLGRLSSGKNLPRTIDIDILLAGEQIIDSPGLIIPHPRMAGRNFVLIPLKEIAPQAVHPVLEVDVEELARKSLDRSVVRKVTLCRSGAGLRKTKKRGTSAPRGKSS